MKGKVVSVVSAAGAAVLLVAGAVQAAVVVDWQSTGALTAGETTVSTQGTLACAYNTGSANTYTVNTVQFDGTAGGGVADLNNEGKVIFNPVDSGSTVNGFSNLGGDFGPMMNSAQWATPSANDTITLGNLVDGQGYLVQVFTSDNRAGRENVLSLDQGTGNQFDLVPSGAANSGAHGIGTFTADSTGEATFTFGYNPLVGNANVNAIQVREIEISVSTNEFIHPGIALSLEDLDHVKANLTVEPWKTGYNDMLASSLSSLSYSMKGPFAEVGRQTNNGAWNDDMEAVHCLARQWYFTGNSAYAQKARDILIAWATTHTLWNNESGTYLSMGYECMHVFEGADILRGTWPGWTQSDTDTVKDYFENVWWDEYHLSVPHPLRSANQGMAQCTAALGVAIFNDDQEKFDQCLQVFLTDAAAALGSTLPNGQVGDTGRDAHDQGQLMLMVWAAEAFWKQGVDVYSVFDNRLLAAAEYISRYNLLLDTPFIQYGTVYDIYPEAHSLEGEYANYGIETKMLTLLHSAYVVRKGMRSPYLERYFACGTQNKDSYCYLKSADMSTATPPDPVTPPAGSPSVTSLTQTNMGDCAEGSARYDGGSGVWRVTGEGSSLWYSSVPDYSFAYLPVTGDATIIARVSSLSGSDSNARAGVVISENLSGSAEMQAMVITNPSGNEELYSIRRGSVASSHNPGGGSGSRSYPRMPEPKVPYWLKIERIGNRINSYSSPDGASWSCGESADYSIGSTVYVGLAVSSGNDGSLATADFTDVRITGGDGGEASEVPSAPYAIYASPGGDRIPLRWLESFEADSYRIWRTTTPGGPYTLLTEQTGTGFTDTNVLYGTHYYYAVSGVNAVGEGPRSPDSSFIIPDIAFYEGEDYDGQSGVQTEGTRDFFGGLNLSRLDHGDWARYDDITISSGAVFRARCAGYGDPVGYIEVRLNSAGGTVVGVIDPIDTDGAQYWATSETHLSAAAVGTHDLYLVFNGQSGGSPGINFNWFDIVYPHISEVDLGMDVTITYDEATHTLINPSSITAWESASTHLNLADGSDLSTLDLAQLGVASWSTLDFDDVAEATIWGGADLNRITLYTDGNFGAGDSFTGADWSDIVWGTPTTVADAAKFFSGGSGATSAANREDAVTFSGADLSLISGAARTVMINNLGGFDGSIPIGARFNASFITRSGWDKAALIAAGWQYHPGRMLVDTATYAAGSPPAVSTSDLAQSQYLSSSARGGHESGEHEQLFNGLLGNEDGDTGDSGEVSLDSGNMIMVTFDTSVNTNGYDLTGITTIFGWNTTDNGRANQGYEIILRYMDSSSETLAGPTHWEPNAPANYWTKVSFGNDDGGVLDSDTIVHNGTPSGGTGVTARGVKSVTFDISHNANAGGWIVAREFDIFGVPTVAAVEAEPAVFLPDISVANGNFNAQFTGTVRQHYRVEYTDDLTGAHAWQTVTDIVSLATSPFEISAPATNDVGFYRVISAP